MNTKDFVARYKASLTLLFSVNANTSGSWMDEREKKKKETVINSRLELFEVQYMIIFICDLFGQSFAPLFTDPEESFVQVLFYSRYTFGQYLFLEWTL